MPDRTQDLKNLRQVAVACKSYVDKSIDNLKWELGTYDLSVDTDNTTALIKTMPSGTIMANVNKIKGASEVSENLITSYEQGTYADQTYTNRIAHNFGSKVQTITIKCFDNNFKCIIQRFTKGTRTYIANETTWFNNSQTITTNGTDDYVIIVSYTDDNILINPNTITYVMAVSGSTAPTEFKQGYEGIHNLELSGLKVENQNLFKVEDRATTTTNNVTYSISNGTITMSGTANGNTYINLFSITLPAGTYKIEDFGTYTPSWASAIIYADNLSFNTATTKTITTNETKTFTFYLSIISGTVVNGTFKPMFVKSSTAPTSFEPYVSQTLPIDLTSIEDSGGNKLFADGSLKGVGNVYDEVTPYKAIKRFGVVDLGSLNWTYNTTSGTNPFFQMQIGDISLEQTRKVICSIYEIYDLWTYAGTFGNSAPNMSIGMRQEMTYVYIRNDSYTDATAFKQAMQGVYLYYELATPIEVDIDFSFLKNIQGYSNGSITAQNTYDMAVPSEIDYLIEEVKA